MTLSNAKELGKRNITVNAIAPGFIDTDMTGVLSDKQKELVMGQISLGRSAHRRMWQRRRPFWLPTALPISPVR